MSSHSSVFLLRFTGWRLNVVIIVLTVGLTDAVVALVDTLLFGRIGSDSMLVSTLSGLIIATLVVSVTSVLRARVAQMQRLTLEQGITRAQSHLSIAIETSKMVYWELDLISGQLNFDHGKLIWLGLATHARAGTITEWLALTHPEDQAGFMQRFQATLPPGAPDFTFDYRMQQASGDWGWVHTQGRVKECNAQGVPILAVGGTFNITQRKLAELALIENKERLEVIFNDNPDLMLISRLTDGCITEVNEAFIRHSGFSREAAVGSTTLGLGLWVHTEDRQRMTDALFSQGRCDNLETVFYNHAGQTIECALDAVATKVHGVSHIVCTVRDISQRKRAEAERNCSEELLRTTLASTDEGILMVGQGGQILSVNERFLELWHVPFDLVAINRDDLLLAHVLEQLVDPDTFIHQVQRLYGTTEQARDTLKFKDGRVFARFTRALQVNGQQGRIWCFKDITEQAKAQEQLVNSEQKLRSILDNVDACIYLKDAEGRYLFANQATCSLWNTKLDQVIGRTDRDFFDESTAQVIQKNDCLVFETGQKIHTEESNQVSNSGRLVIYQSIKLPLCHEDGSIYALCGISTDITAIKQLNAELEVSNQFQSALMEAIPIPIFYQDDQGKFLGANTAYDTFMGLPRNALVGKTVADVVSADLAATYQAQNLDLMSRRGTLIYETRIEDGAGVPHDVIFHKAVFTDTSNNVGGIIGGFLDITARKQSEQALRDSEEKLSAIFNSANAGISIVDRSGHYKMVNQCWANSLGYGVDEMLGLTYEHVTHPADMDEARSKFEQMCAGVLANYRLEKRYVKKDQSVIWTDLSVAAIKGKNQQVEYVLGMLVDITERKQSEQELIESEQRTQALYTLLRMVADNVPDMIWAKDIDGHYLFANKAICEQLLMATDTDEPLGKDDLYFAQRERSRYPENPQWHTFGELCQDSDAVTLQRGCASQFNEFGNVKGKPLFLDVRKAPLVGENDEIIGVVGSARDVTAEREAHEKLLVAASVLANSSEALILSDANNCILDVNPAFTKLTGYTLDEVRGKTPQFLNSDKQGDNFYKSMWAQIVATGTWQGEVWNQRKNGNLFAEWLTVNTLYHDDGRVYRRVGLFSDITDKKRSEELVWSQANFDSLTGLPNRRMFLDRLGQDLKKAQRGGFKLALLFLDLDRFKEINDTLGHDVGDVLLTEAARRIAACARESDTVARLGGDEFTVILAELTDTTGVDRMANNILTALTQPFALGAEQAYVSVSIGITVYPNDALSLDDLLKNADQAMYVSKNGGRNRFSYFTRAMQDAAQHRLHLLNDLRGALAQNQFELHYQPIVDLRSGQILKAEALLRWVHPVRGHVSPDTFIALAEESGLIHEIGHWVFAQATLQAQRWRTRYAPAFQISVNLSPVQIQSDANQLPWQQLLQAADLNGDAVAMEITEGTLLGKSESVTQALLAYRDAGIQVAIDDFGTGYSAMAYLKQLHIDYLKIDKSFVHTLAADSSDHALCKAMVVMAHTLGLKVIAEGVETAQQRDLLKAMGCDHAQGYLYARALPAQKFEHMFFSHLPLSDR